MPFYVSRSMVVRRYSARVLGYIADRDGDQDLDEDAVDDAIADAEAYANSFIGARYPLPLPDVTDRVDPENNEAVPAYLRRAVTDVAVYLLTADHDQLTEERTRRYERACQWLKDVAGGSATLGLPEGSEVEGEIQHATADRVFTRDTMKGLL